MDRAEAALRGALSAAGVKWTELPGEGAFYGPKIEYHMHDSIGRDWQVGTMQVDFMMPERLGAEYVAMFVPSTPHSAVPVPAPPLPSNPRLLDAAPRGPPALLHA